MNAYKECCTISLKQCPEVDWQLVAGSGVVTNGDSFEVQSPQTTGWVNDTVDDTNCITDTAAPWEFSFTTGESIGNKPLMVGLSDTPNALASWTSIDVGFYMLYRDGVYHNAYTILSGGLVFELNFGTAVGDGDNRDFLITYDGTTLEWFIDGTSVRTQAWTPPATLCPSSISYYTDSFWNGTAEIVDTVLCGGSDLSGCYCDVLQAVADLIPDSGGGTTAPAQVLSSTEVAGETTQITLSGGGGTVNILHNHPTPVTPTLNKTTRVIYSEEYFARSLNGLTQLAARNATITRTAAGQWTVALATAHPDGVNYHVSLTAEEQSANRDTPDITVVQGTQTATGFQIQITTGDNGTSADAYIDTPWSFGIDAPVTVLEDVTIV